jgi:hypothetical protein
MQRFIQYFVYPLLNAIHAVIWSTIESTSFRHSSWILGSFQASSTEVQKSSLVGKGFWWIFFFITLHIFLIWFKFGDYGGHSIVRMLLTWRKFTVGPLLWLGALSCWNMHLLVWNKACLYGTKWFCNVLIYVTVFIVRGTYTSGPRPQLPEKLPHNRRLWRKARRLVVWLSDIFSIFPRWTNCMRVPLSTSMYVSSKKITLIEN